LTVTDGNLCNNHLYLSGVMDMFPADVIGGPNKKQPAPRTVRVEWGGEIVETDIVGDKKLFRKRGWVGKFFKTYRVGAGDLVRLEQLSPYVYRVSRLDEEMAAVA
jgi:hypothetical protein